MYKKKDWLIITKNKKIIFFHNIIIKENKYKSLKLNKRKNQYQNVVHLKILKK